MINFVTDLIIMSFDKIFTWLGKNWLYIIIDIVVFLVVFTWLCDVYAKKEAAQLRKYHDDLAREERKKWEEREYQERQRNLPK
jgi:hypothetical protein